LNAGGEAFLARGYRPSEDRDKLPTVPLAAWITGRHEEQISLDFSNGYLNRVELISGGSVADLPFSYFIEWRVGSLESRSDGSLRDRSGRFEDAFLNWELNQQNVIRIGQYRALNQVDVSRRLSVSEPVLLSGSLPGDASHDPRITSLRAFSPSGRSPGFSYQYQSISGERPSDGLFHIATLPFVGEFSIPLSSEAHDEASFELQGPPKGVFLETFYRQELNSIGVHSFIDDDRFILTGLGTLQYDDFYLTAGIGGDDRDAAPARLRYSVELEYIPSCSEDVRPGFGFRIEDISKDGRQPAYIPYFVLSAPNESYTVLLQVEYRGQKDNEAFFLDLSVIF
jgi:hypothetical protein